MDDSSIHLMLNIIAIWVCPAGVSLFFSQHARSEPMQWHSMSSCNRTAWRIGSCSRQRHPTLRASLRQLAQPSPNSLRQHHPLIDLCVSPLIKIVQLLSLERGSSGQRAAGGQDGSQVGVLLSKSVLQSRKAEETDMRTEHLQGYESK
jgi:hypothetical protein